MRLFMILLLAAGVSEGALINDGSFENGTCGDGSDWTCTTTHPACETILDPTGYWGSHAFHGDLAAWLGGVCDNEGISNSVCQDIVITPSQLSWWWMGWYTLIAEQEATLRVKVDGQIAWEHLMTSEDHTVGSWASSVESFGIVDLRRWEDGQVHTLCFEFDNYYSNNGGTTVSMLVDWIELSHPVAAEEASFSAIKVRY